MTAIRGKNVLITGAARGLGHKMAERFLLEGATVLLVDRDETALTDTAHTLAFPGRVFSFICDVSKQQNIDLLKQEIMGKVGRIDILINNAGIIHGGSYTEVDPTGDEGMLSVNVNAVHWMTKTFLPDLIDSPEGHIVQMASAAGFFGVAYQVVYCASKWFVIGLSEALRQELRHQGHSHIHITIVSPSFVQTGMFAGVKAPRFTPFLSTDKAAKKVISAVKKNRLYVKTPFMVKASPILQAILPARILDLLIDFFGTNRAMAGFKGHAQ